MYTKPAPCWEVPHPLQPSGYIPQLINPLFFISWCNFPAKLQSVCFMGTQWCHPAHNWSTQQSTELFIICINIIVKGKCFDLAETNLILLGLFCFQHFLLLEKFPRNFATSSWVRRQWSLNARNSHRNKISRYDQVRLFSIYFHFFQVISCLHRNENASCHCDEPSDLGLVALLWLMKGGRVGPSACSKKEFVKRELCTSHNAAFAGYAERWISSFKCCTYKPRVVQSRGTYTTTDKINPLKFIAQSTLNLLIN